MERERGDALQAQSERPESENEALKNALYTVQRTFLHVKESDWLRHYGLRNGMRLIEFQHWTPHNVARVTKRFPLSTT